uniref:CRAL-TRIO domain-containing protein n=1 Tax=Glossina brevipalpis TaxID=37001 RepID=A0A1A9WQS5_9MUSC
MCEEFFNFEGVSEFAKEVALKELEETPENVVKGLKELKCLLKLQTNIEVPIDNDLWLMSFLRFCKFRPEAAKEKIMLYLKMKRSLNFVGNFQFNDMRLPEAEGIFSILKQRDQLGRRVSITRIEHWNPSTLDKYKALHVVYPASNLILLEPDTQINGCVYILDCKGLSYTHIPAITPHFVKTCIDYVVNVLPMRMRGFHIVNNPLLFQPIFALVKQFLPEEYSSLVMMHGKNMKELHRYIAAEYLPECYGAADQTPTPTSLIKNCEEVGLFEDLQHVNPFEETFRRACEQHVYQNPTSQQNNTSLNTDEDSLHTPQVFPQFDIATEGGICDVEDIAKQTLDTPVLCENVRTTKQVPAEENVPTRVNVQNDTETINCIVEKTIIPQVIPSISFMPPSVIELQPQMITLTIPANNTQISQEKTAMITDSTKSRRLLPKPTDNTRIRATETVTVSSTTIQSVRNMPLSVNEPSSASLTPTSQLPIKERLKAILNQNSKTEWSSTNHKYHLNKNKCKTLPRVRSSNDTMERKRAASSRYRHKMRNEHKELIKRNYELLAENEKLIQRIKHLEMEVKKLQQSNAITEQVLKTSDSKLILPTQLQIPASTIHLLMNIPKVVIPFNVNDDGLRHT